jgi:hypothetical protein
MYAFFYQLNEKLQSNDSKFYSGVFVIVAIIFQVLLAGAIFKTFTGSYLSNSFGYPSNKFVFLPFAALLIWGLERIFKKYGDVMIKKYETRNLLSFLNAFIILALVFVPLIVSILLLKK